MVSAKNESNCEKKTTCNRQRIRNRRNGLSLLEVILAIAILGVSMAAIGQLYNLGYRSALKARLINEGNLIAGSKMAELVAGVIPIESTGDTPVPESQGWTFSVNVQSSLQPGLFMATVVAKRESNNGVPTNSISVVRFIPDPDYEPEEEGE